MPFVAKVLTLIVLAAAVLLPAEVLGARAVPASARAYGLRWKGAKIQIAISSSLTRENAYIKTGSDVEGAIKRSLETWESVAGIEFTFVSSDRQSVSPAGPAGDGVSLISVAPTAENALLFAGDLSEVAATTRVFFSSRGYITEADIILNPYQQFSTDGTLGTFDLEATLTHEIGHLLGLDHSPVLGSTMHESYGKNGVYGLQNFAARTLSASDIAAVRAIYGPRDDSLCCGQITGKLLLPGGKAAKGATVWLEDPSGRVQSMTRTTGDGFYRLEGISSGIYKVFAQGEPGTRSAFPAQEVGETMVDRAETPLGTKRLNAGPRGLEISYIGLNGQLSDLAVPVSPGRTYTVYLGGKQLDPKQLTIGSSSPYISLIPESIRAQEYDQVSAVSFEIRIAPTTPKGDYSLSVENAAGGRTILIGGITVDTFPLLSIAPPLSDE